MDQHLVQKLAQRIGVNVFFGSFWARREQMSGRVTTDDVPSMSDRRGHDAQCLPAGLRRTPPPGNRAPAGRLRRDCRCLGLQRRHHPARRNGGTLAPGYRSVGAAGRMGAGEWPSNRPALAADGYHRESGGLSIRVELAYARASSSTASTCRLGTLFTRATTAGSHYRGSQVATVWDICSLSRLLPHAGSR